MTILEAMNCHTPILLRDLDIYHDILFDFYLRAENVDGFEEELRRLRSDAEYYTAASGRAARGHDFYSRENVAKMWRTFYEDILSKRPQKRERRPAGTLVRRAGTLVRRAGSRAAASSGEEG